jgi:hypothetical protein
MRIPNPHPRRLPTDDEVKHCKVFVEGLDVETDKIKMDISRLQKQLDALEEKRINYLSFISPIRCLPPELISDICLACVKAGMSPMTLNQVCGRFREIVNNTSELWSHICLTDHAWIGSRFSGVNIYHVECAHTELNLFQIALSSKEPKLIELVLQRASPAFLDIAWELPFTPTIFNLIKPYTHRIRSLSLASSSYYEWQGSETPLFFNCNLGSLRHVVLVDQSEPDIRAYLDFLSGLKLDEITLEIQISTYFPSWFNGTSIWERITNLNLTIYTGTVYQSTTALNY